MEVKSCSVNYPPEVHHIHKPLQDVVCVLNTLNMTLSVFMTAPSSTYNYLYRRQVRVALMPKCVWHPDSTEQFSPASGFAAAQWLYESWTLHPGATESAALWQISQSALQHLQTPPDSSQDQLIAQLTPDLPLLAFFNAICHSLLLLIMLQAPSGLSIGLINTSIVQSCSLSGYLVINDT